MHACGAAHWFQQQQRTSKQRMVRRQPKLWIIQQLTKKISDVSSSRRGDKPNAYLSRSWLTEPLDL